MIMAIKQARLTFVHPSNEQPEDYLTRCLLHGSIRKMKELAPWAFDRNGNAIYPPNEVHVMLEWAVNTLMGWPVDRFSCTYTLSQILRHLFGGGGAVLSGIFPIGASGELNHMVSLAGVELDGKSGITLENGVSDLDRISSIDFRHIKAFIIDDPYGDWRTGYRSHRGNDVPLSFQEFNMIFKEKGNVQTKWAHLVGEVKA
jgi:hypothetical protein